MFQTSESSPTLQQYVYTLVPQQCGRTSSCNGLCRMQQSSCSCDFFYTLRGTTINYNMCSLCCILYTALCVWALLYAMYFAKTKTQIALTSIKSTKGKEKRVRFTAVPQEQSWSHPSQSSQLVMVPALLNNRTFRIISQTARSQRKTLVLQNIETYSSTVNAKTAVSTQNQGSHRCHRIRDSWGGRTLLTSPHRNVPFFQNRFTEWFQVSGTIYVQVWKPQLRC